MDHLTDYTWQDIRGVVITQWHCDDSCVGGFNHFYTKDNLAFCKAQCLSLQNPQILKLMSISTSVFKTDNNLLFLSQKGKQMLINVYVFNSKAHQNLLFYHASNVTDSTAELCQGRKNW